MNFLFYVGIIVPTVITIALFIIFIYCWFLQKARKEVLTKKYDPHGKMRSLGMSMKFPPPPTFCLVEDVHFLKIGADNIAYDVSRSPSTVQDGQGRALYHTYHDSGISAGLSPSRENEFRHSLVYRTCPDSDIPGLASYPTQGSHRGSRDFCLTIEQNQRQPQLQQLCGDQIHIHAHQQQYHQQAAQQHNSVHSPTHPNLGTHYSDDMDKPQSTPQYNPALAHSSSMILADYHDRRIGISSREHKYSSQPLMPHQTSILSLYHEISEPPVQPSNDQIFFHTNQTTQSSQCHQMHNNLGRRDKVMPVSPSHDLSNMSGPPFSPSISPLHQPTPISDINVHKGDLMLLSSPTKPLKHSYRDSGIADSGQCIPAIAERPDSQASQSSTTDSEDSGFRSSYCAAHNKSVLSKQTNPLLKPLRKSRASRNYNKPSRKTSSCNDYPPSNYPQPLSILSPINLDKNVSNSMRIDNSSRNCPQRPHRSLNSPQQQHIVVSSVSNETILASPTAAQQAGAALTFHDSSPTNPLQKSSPLDIWPTMSNDVQETAVEQCINLNDISTHLSWKYLQNISSSKKPNSGLTADDIMLEPCVPGVKPGQTNQINRDQHVEQYGYSMV